MKKALAALVLALAVSTTYGSSTLDRGQRGDDEDGYQQTRTSARRSYDKDYNDDEGCPAKKVAVGVLMYLPNRVFDLMDAVHLSGSYGPPGSVNVRATNKLWWGVSELNVHRVGLIGKRFAFYQKEKLHDECGGNFFDIWKCGDTPRPPWQVGVDLHLHCGVRAAVDLDELADFLCGFVLVDTKGDDYSCPEKKVKTKVEKKKVVRRYAEYDEDGKVGRGEAMK